MKKKSDTTVSSRAGVEGSLSDQAKPVVNEWQEKAEAHLQGWKKALADYQNLLKEMRKKEEEIGKYATRSMVMELLPIVDNFHTATQYIPEEEKKSGWVVGMMHIQQQLRDLLKKHGVEKIKTIGEKVDLHQHEVVGSEDSDKKEEIIIKEIKPGYRMYDKVISVAKVIVSKNKNDKN